MENNQQEKNSLRIDLHFLQRTLYPYIHITLLMFYLVILKFVGEN